MPVLCEIEKTFHQYYVVFIILQSVLGYVLRLEVVRFFVSFSQVLFIYFILNQKKFANMKWTA